VVLKRKFLARSLNRFSQHASTPVPRKGVRAPAQSAQLVVLSGDHILDDSVIEPEIIQPKQVIQQVQIQPRSRKQDLGTVLSDEAEKEEGEQPVTKKHKVDTLETSVAVAAPIAVTTRPTRGASKSSTVAAPVVKEPVEEEVEETDTAVENMETDQADNGDGAEVEEQEEVPAKRARGRPARTPPAAKAPKEVPSDTEEASPTRKSGRVTRRAPARTSTPSPEPAGVPARGRGRGRGRGKK